jgi:parallel beta-helix repeat protein
MNKSSASLTLDKACYESHIMTVKSNWHVLIQFTGILILMLLSVFPVKAQPSGGPYGPVRQRYEIPATHGKVYYAAPDGKAAEKGESLTSPTTIEAAFDRVVTGDVIILRGGTYRTGNLILNQGITIQPYADERPVLKGTLIAREWKSLNNGLWTTSWTQLFPSKPADWWSRSRFGKETPLCLFNNDMVFIDGRFLKAVSREGEVDENSYFIDYDTGLVYIGTDPQNRLVEITAFDIALHRIMSEYHGRASDHLGPVIRGITFTQYAYRALEVDGVEPTGISEESKHGKDVTGTTLENCTISFCSRVAAYLRGDKLTIKNCKITDTSTEGIYIIGSSDVLLEKNIFTRNNIERINGYYPAAVKIFNQSYRVTCKDNLVIDLPYSNGIWYDVGNVDGQFINNWVENVGITGRKLDKKRPWPSDNGFFFEISKGAICAGNVFVNCDQGIFILNSSNVQIYQNTFVNSTATIGRNGRSPANDGTFGWHSGTGPDVNMREGHVFVNNLLTGDETYSRPLLFVWQPDTMCKRLDKPQFKQIDNNVYVRSEESESEPLILWSPAMNIDCQAAYSSTEELNKQNPQFSKGSINFTYEVPLFKSRELGNYQLLPSFPGTKNASQLPPDISRLLGLSKKVKAYIGAYPLQE